MFYDETAECFIQADLISENTDQDQTAVQEVTEFVSEVETIKVDIAAPPSSLMSLSDEYSSLIGFLSRPFEIHTQTWTEGTALDPATHNFLPWYLYLNRTPIKNKLSNYYLFRGNLHLKVVVNASPFYYGCAMLSYAPCTNMESAVVTATGSTAYNVGYSQRPNIKIYPQSNQGGELVLPFFWPEEWVDLTSASDVQNLGRCRFSSFGDLQNSNGVTGASITMQVFAWIDNPQLSGPTANSVLQSGKIKDEYNEGPLSKPASAIARASGLLSDLPLLGSFFTATSMAAGKVAGVAKLFGYTNVPVIDDVHAYRPNPMPHLSTCDIGVPSEKLTLDAKNELSTDPCIIGLSAKDELLLSTFCQRESFVFDFDWNMTDAAGATLVMSHVTPDVKRVITNTQQKVVHRSPMGHAAIAFKYWRGTIKFRFKILCSQYHRGRLIIVWNPPAGPLADGDTQFNKIVDISENTDIEISVPYMQPTAYLECPVSTDTEEWWDLVATPSGAGLVSNGVVGVFVNNPLTGPTGTGSVKVLVSMSAGSDFELCAPRAIDVRNSPYTVQSEDVAVYDTDRTTLDFGNVKTITDNNINLLYHGESIKSLRTLYRRNGFYRTSFHEQAHSGTTLFSIFESKQNRRPLYPGFDTNGVDSATGLISATTEPFNWVQWIPMTWFDMCFVGTRGSVRWVNTFYYTSSNSNMITAARYTGTTSLNAAAYDFNRSSETSEDAVRRRIVIAAPLSTVPGVSGGNTASNPSLDTTFPLYSRYKFLEASPNKRTLGLSDVGSDLDAISLSLLTRPIYDGDGQATFVTHGISAGTDYTPVFFLNVPTMYLYDSLPSAP